MRAAVYCRVSTDKGDQANSFQSQKRYFGELIERRPDLSLYEIYADEGVSGTNTAKRREFNRMIGDARERKFDCIITKEVSRFARNTVDTLKYTRELKMLGIGVEFDNDGINTLEPDAELRLSIMSSIAQEESRKTSSRVKWGQTRRMEQGVVFGRSMLGYDVEKGRMTVNEDGAEIVRKIYHWYTEERLGTQEIAQRLMNEGFLTVRGNRAWSSSVIVKILRNEKYCGDLLQKKTVTPDYLSHRKVRNQGQEEMIFLRDHHEPIISRELWEETQREISRRARKTPSKGRKNGAGTAYPLSGKIRCGQCGGSFVARERTKRNGETYLVWRCQTAVKAGSKSGKGCSLGFQLKNETAVKMIWDLLDSAEQDKGRMKDELAAVIARGKEWAGCEQRQRTERLMRQMNLLEQKQRKLLDAYLDEKISDDEMEKMREEYRRQTEEITARLSKYEGEVPDHNEGKKLAEGVVEDGLSVDEDREIIAGRAVEYITVYPDRSAEIFLKGADVSGSYPI